MHEHRAGGLEHLALVTSLLQSARLANPDGGVFEAADLQWWWRRDQHADAAASTFWLDDDGRPLAAIVFTDWGDRTGCDLLDARHDSAAALELAGARFRALLDAHAGSAVEMTIRAGDDALLAAATAAGFAVTDHAEVTTTMAASARPPSTAPPDGFVVASRAERLDRPHHLIARNGEHVAARLGECSLYRADLDLCVVETATDAVAAYGVFWADPVTAVGLVEPMRTEDRFQGRGLASALLRAGVERLATSGCAQLRVTYATDNAASRRLYLGTGFRGTFECRTYRREAR